MVMLVVAMCGFACIATPIQAISPSPVINTDGVIGDEDWLGVVNAYRAMSGLNPVSERSDWSTGAQLHSCYMLVNGISHDEQTTRDRYTLEGDVAGNGGNVAVSNSTLSTARSHIDLWMTGPFHAIGVLRPSLTEVGFGVCEDEAGSRWRSGATLDVIRGLDQSALSDELVTFPGPGAVVPLNSFVTETPNPVALCNWTGSAGLPILALMPHDVTRASATLIGPTGPIETCVLHQNNVSDPHARALLANDHAVVVMPRVTLADGNYSVAIESDGGAAQWGFTVDRYGALRDPSTIGHADTTVISSGAGFEPVNPLRVVDTRIGLGATRLIAGGITAVRVAASDVSAVSATVAAVDPDGPGYVTLFACGPAAPLASTLNYAAGDVVSNFAVIPLRDGELCVQSRTGADVVIDVTGYYRAEGPGSFVAEPPQRILDTRQSLRLAAGVATELNVVATADAGTTVAVALNATVVNPDGPGWLRVFPCGSPTNDSSAVSLNFSSAFDIRASAVVAATDPQGSVCLQSSVATDVVIDRTGRFVVAGGAPYTALDPIRLLDTRVGGVRLEPNVPVVVAVAGTRGIPALATAASVNLTAVGASGPGFITAYPCGPVPATSNLNMTPWRPVVANAALVALSEAGGLCIVASTATDVVVDINGVWA